MRSTSCAPATPSASATASNASAPTPSSSPTCRCASGKFSIFLPMTIPTDKARRWAPLLLAAVLSACATANPALEQSQADFARSDPLAAYVALEDAVRRDPANLELRAWWLRQRELLGADYLAAAEQARLRG